MKAINIVLMLVALAFAMQFAFNDVLDYSPVNVFAQIINEGWGSQDIWQWMISTVWITASGFVVAGAVLNRSIYIYSGFAASMATWVASFYQIAARAKADFLFGGTPEVNHIVDFLLIAFSLIYCFMLIEFVRGRDN